MNRDEPTVTDRTWLDAVRDAAIADAESRLSDQHLTAQQEQIVRRLATLERQAEIIAFPGARLATRRIPVKPHRWVAAAAVVGLMTGLLAGRFLHLHPRELVSTPEVGIERTAPAVIADTLGPVVTAYNEEAILVDIDTSLYTPRIPELRALDALTPSVRESAFTH
jgi:hypothetical protein